MELTEFGFKDVRLLEGENIAFAINVADPAGRPSSKFPEALLLTDTRVIHLSGPQKNRRAVMAAVADIGAVEITSNRRGVAAYLWAALAFVLAAVLFGTMENSAVRLGASSIVLLMGVYLIVSQLTEPGRPTAIFKAGNTEISWSYVADDKSDDVNSFISRLFQIKASAESKNGAQRTFAPR